MKIREATLADAVAIAQLHTDSWRNTYATVLSPAYLAQVVPAEREQVWRGRLAAPKENQRVIVAEMQDNIVGFACLFTEHHDAWGSCLDNLHIAAPYQGQGVGRALLGEVVRWCERKNPGMGLYLSVNQDNLRAQAFYRRLGARNAEPSVWSAPDGSQVPTFWFVWDSARLLSP
nr:GNAT family N-acetyltransferase [uncultured Rhodoferax sp.]